MDSQKKPRRFSAPNISYRHSIHEEDRPYRPSHFSSQIYHQLPNQYSPIMQFPMNEEEYSHRQTTRTPAQFPIHEEQYPHNPTTRAPVQFHINEEKHSPLPMMRGFNRPQNITPPLQNENFEVMSSPYISSDSTTNTLDSRRTDKRIREKERKIRKQIKREKLKNKLYPPDSLAIKINNEITAFAGFSLNIRDAYWGQKTHTSLTLDIIAIYLKGQKILYIESKTLCEQRLHTLMLPAIFISAACTVLSISLTSLSYGATIVSTLTAVNSFILAVINFLKLDAKAEAHKTSSYRFDKLQTQCEFYSGKLLFLENKKSIDAMEGFVETIEKQVEDIKDTNQFIIPEEIRYRYPNLYSINIFSEVKRLRNEEKVLRNTLFSLFNEEHKETDVIKKEVLQAEKKRVLDRILRFHEKYIIIDDSINKEINDYIYKKKCGCCMNWLKT